MTAQYGELLEYDGRKMKMFTEPLERYLSTLEKRPEELSTMHNTACWRGYIGEWRIIDSKLFLVRLCIGWPGMETANTRIEQHERNFKSAQPKMLVIKPGMFSAGVCTPIEIPLGAVFKDAADQVFASWFSGIIRVPHGKLLYYRHMGYASIYESDLMLLLSHGNLAGSFTLDNKKIRLTGKRPSKPRKKNIKQQSIPMSCFTKILIRSQLLYCKGYS